MNKILTFLVISLIFSSTSKLQADEGMWIPLLLNALNETEMQSMGMKMTAEDIYSVNKGSLKDGIAHFGGFCTSEVISNEGLLLTNHHCGYGAIQSHSTVEKNYLKDGFWAMSRAEELPNDGLFATFIVRIEDVTDKVFYGLKKKDEGTTRQSIIDKNIDAIKKSAIKERHEEVFIRPFFKGNQYFLFVTETFTDVRLVGAPPESIGKFGADTDNWVWPRHTGDFSMFRIYAGKDNLPADYSPDNVPYKPKHFFPISLDGVEEDDFSLVFGFPGRTNQYLPSYAVAQVMDVLDPAKIGVREISLDIMGKYMRADEGTRLQYSSKFAGIANSWKKWIGESQGLRSTGAVQKKKAMEAEFTERINSKRRLSKAYGDLLPSFERLYAEIEPYAVARDYYSEVFGRNVEIFRIAGQVKRLVDAYENNGQAGYDGFKDRLQNYLAGFQKDYNPKIDAEILTSLLQLLREKLPSEYLPEILANKGKSNDWGNQLFQSSMLGDISKLSAFMDKGPENFKSKLESDALFQMYSEITSFTDSKISPKYNALNEEITANMQTYMKGLMEVFPEKKFWPDANSTLRVSYGQIAGYEPMDAVRYHHVSYLKGVIQKYQPGDYEFDVHPKLIELYENRDFGPYEEDGKIAVCFIGKNHTSGGNSGSPAIDAYGNLIGVNFDRVWEGTMSDLSYDPSICRNIMVDIRYVLFVVDKFAGAGHLVKEMKLVHPKKG